MTDPTVPDGDVPGLDSRLRRLAASGEQTPMGSGADLRRLGARRTRRRRVGTGLGALVVAAGAATGIGLATAGGPGHHQSLQVVGPPVRQTTTTTPPPPLTTTTTPTTAAGTAPATVPTATTVPRPTTSTSRAPAATSPVPTTTSTTVTAANLPSAPDCTTGAPGGGTTGVRPTRLFVGCASEADSVDAISWSTWTPAAATGVGTYQVDNCVPNCAQGSYSSYPVAVDLTDPTPIDSRATFHLLLLTPTTSQGAVQSAGGPGQTDWGFDPASG